LDNENIARRLAAIFAADMVGYSRLMEADEEGTIARQAAHRKELIDPKIAEHNGRIVKLMGDGMLVEFGSVVGAVKCAVEIQAAMDERDADVPDDIRIRYRVGINLGDVVIDGDDILGDGVNVAARLEALAEPGGICISGTVFEHVNTKLDARFDDLGEQTVKNIARAVRIYRVRPGTPDASPVTQAASPGLDAQQENLPTQRAAIAVLPFDNMSGDTEQEYFCDGVVEDIITELSKFRWLRVIARNTTFTYKGKPVDVQAVGRELGVGYVVEGSVRRAGNRIRITAQLIDCHDGGHIWAERYDRELEDIFDLQDDITRTLVANIAPELGQVEREIARTKATENLNAWDLYQRAIWHRYQLTREDYETTVELCRKAIELDPNFAAAYALLSLTGYTRTIFGYVQDREAVLKEAVATGQQSIAIDPREPDGYCGIGLAQMLLGDLDSAERYTRRAISLNPNYAHAYFSLALALGLGTEERSQEVADAVSMAIELSPRDPMLWGYHNILGWDQLASGDPEAALASFETSSRLPTTTFWPFIGKGAALALLGRSNEAQQAINEAMSLNSDISVEACLRMLNGQNNSRYDAAWEGAVLAGLPKS
jgi:adenylate cyclase